MRLTFDLAVEKYEASLIRRGFSKTTLSNKSAYLSLLKKWLNQGHQEALQDMRAMSCDILEGYIDYLALKGLELSSMQIYISNVKVFFKFLYKNDLVLEDYSRKIENVRVPKKEIVIVPHDKIMKVLDDILLKSEKGMLYEVAVRNYWIFRCAYVTGWRASEAIACDVENIDWETGDVYLPRRKGGKDGHVYFDSETLQGLKKWYFSNYPNGKCLFYSMKGRRISYSAYKKAFKNYFGLATHRFRASFATYLHSQGVDIKNIADLMAHDSLSSTMRYVARDQSKIKAIHAKKNPFSSAVTD